VAIPDSPATRASLLIRLRDRSNQPAWDEFVSLYGPVIYGFARKRGLQDADAADTMQDVLRSVASAMERLDYDPRQGSFRGWLFTITRNKVFNHLSKGRGKAKGTGDSNAYAQLSNHPDDQPGLEDAWERDYQRQIASTVMEQLRPEFQPGTWQAFWRTAVDGEPAADVGRALGMSPGAVYVAKSRVLARLRDEVQARLQLEEVET
jgi:RNA polymerase sigma factor (sigma-70 family)